MVNVRKRGNVYEYNFDVAKIEGKRKLITKSGFKTKAEAQEAYKNIIEKYLKPSLGLYRLSAITSVTLHSFLYNFKKWSRNKRCCRCVRA